MAMTITEADAVAKLVRFILSGELYTGQPESASATAARLVYLAGRAEKVLQLNLPGDADSYAARLEALAPQAPDDAKAGDSLLCALKEIDEIHIDWGKTDMDEINQLVLWERLGRILRRVGV